MDMTGANANTVGNADLIDFHAHYLAPSLVERIQRGEFGPHLTATGQPGQTRFRFPETTSRSLFGAMTDIQERIRHLDECHITIQVLSTWIDMFGYDLPEDVATTYHTRVNEGLAEAVGSCPDRLRFLASVPLPWGDAAADVLKDAVNRLGAIGSMIGTNVCGTNLDDPRLEPLWAMSEKLDVPVELHPVDVAGADRLGRYQLDNFLGNPFDTTIAASSLILGGVLDRHPSLSVILVHGGGYLPYASSRLTHGWRARAVAPNLQREPADYLDRFFYDTVVYDHPTLKALTDIVGIERLVIGTDYPFDMEPPDVRGIVTDVLGSSSLEVLADNARRLSGERG
jgi:aminocarboxymuconate-semialdehyde decarboxylase